ncbi:MAG TPA: hypothetical protein VNG33_17225, partial [Polyangiaceae bacterium]|nr:hypothetical protein [Polyangiaceae bacterium]
MAANIRLLTASRVLASDGYDLAHLSDDELLTSTRRLVGASNQLFAALLAHLAEVEARGIHRTRACASLYTYCIYELRFSEDAAARRSSAAKFVKRFPALLDAVAAGELHLTGLLMLGPHLTEENHVEVLGRAKFRTKKEIARLIRILDPLPHVPDLVEPLGPALARLARRPTWEQFVQSLCPPVRELPPGERPQDWANDALESPDVARLSGELDSPEFAGDPRGTGLSRDSAGLELERADELSPTPKLPPLTAPQHYQMQFTTSEEHVRLVERAKALLSRTQPGLTLGEIHLEAVKMFVAALEKRKFAATARPRPRVKPSPAA